MVQPAKSLKFGGAPSAQEKGFHNLAKVVRNAINHINKLERELAELKRIQSRNIPTWQQRCEKHPDHNGIVTSRMIQDRMQEEIDELRQALYGDRHNDS